MHPVEILVPEGSSAPSDGKLVAMFLDCLLATSQGDQLLEISGGMLTSGNPKLRNVFNMVLRAKRLDQFIQQLTPLLFASPGSKGILRCVVAGQHRSFEIFEQRALPNLKWRIVCGA